MEKLRANPEFPSPGQMDQATRPPPQKAESTLGTTPTPEKHPTHCPGSQGLPREPGPALVDGAVLPGDKSGGALVTTDDGLPAVTVRLPAGEYALCFVESTDGSSYSECVDYNQTGLLVYPQPPW